MIDPKTHLKYHNYPTPVEGEGNVSVGLTGDR